MPGLEIKYQLQSAAPPLVRVLGPRTAAPGIPAGRALGGLTLLGYGWEPAAEGVRVRLTWRVDHPLEQDYTTTVQLLDADGNKLAQDDSRAGGLYYPSSLWKPGERLVEEHVLVWRGEPPAGATLLVGMYAGPDLQPLGPPLRLAIPRPG